MRNATDHDRRDASYETGRGAYHRSTATPGRLRGCVALGVALAGLIALAGCGGPQGPSEKELQMRQETACQRVGDELFRCSVEDARHAMTPDEFAELQPDQLEPIWKSRFMGECVAGEMSLRQIKVFEDCMANTACATFVPCLDAAQAK